MESKISEDQALEMIKEIRKIRFNWQKHRFLKVDINSVGPESKELSIEERRKLLWNFIVDNYRGDEVEEVASPNGDKTYSKKCGQSPLLGVIYFVYIYKEVRAAVFLWVCPKFCVISVEPRNAGLDYDEIREMIDDSLNKAMAKHSLSVCLSDELSMEDMDAYRAYMRDPITESIFEGDSSPFLDIT